MVKETKSQSGVEEGTAWWLGQVAAYFCSGDSLLSPRFRMQKPGKSSIWPWG